MSETAFNAFAIARDRFDRTAELMGLEPTLRELLRTPMHEHAFTLPVRMDDGRVRLFSGHRVVHNDARGPAWGGVRFHPQETLDTVRGLAMVRTWQTAVVDIPLGGSMGGVVCDPHTLSPREQERLCRMWVRRIARLLGPEREIASPDLMTHGQHMAWMLDEYETITGGHRPAAITGKPVNAGGSKGRKSATGYGLVYALREALRELGVDPGDTTASVQGFGNVAQNAVELYTQIGGTVTCVAAWDQQAGEALAFRRREGIDLGELRSLADAFGGIDRAAAERAGYEVLPGEAWLEQPVDILIPAALEHQLNHDNVGRIHPSVRLVIEGASDPTTPEAETALLDRKTIVVPDLLANAGGVVCSYFEAVQGSMNYYWSLAEVLSKIDVALTNAYAEASELARSKTLSLREAALAIGIDRVAAVCQERGWI